MHKASDAGDSPSVHSGSGIDTAAANAAATATTAAARHSHDDSLSLRSLPLPPQSPDDAQSLSSVQMPDADGDADAGAVPSGDPHAQFVSAAEIRRRLNENDIERQAKRTFEVRKLDLALTLN